MPKPLHKTRILHIERESGDGLMVAGSLPEALEMEFAHTLEDAQSMLAQHAFDLVVLDTEMPDGSALTLLPMLQEGSGPPAPVILFSSQEMSLETEEDEAASPHERVLSSIRSWLNHRDFMVASQNKGRPPK